MRLVLLDFELMMVPICFRFGLCFPILGVVSGDFVFVRRLSFRSPFRFCIPLCIPPYLIKYFR